MLFKKNSDPRESMEGLFTIIQGQYAKRGPKMDVRGDEVYIGGYDPSDTRTVGWFQAVDVVTWHYVYCGSSYEDALESIRRAILHWKTRKSYFRHVSRATTEDYYEVHYLGHDPLDDDGRERKRQDGKSPRPSDKMKALHQLVHREYGSHFASDVRKVEVEALAALDKRDPVADSRRRVSKLKRKLSNVEVAEPESGASLMDAKAHNPIMETPRAKKHHA